MGLSELLLIIAFLCALASFIDSQHPWLNFSVVLLATHLLLRYL